MFGRFFEKDQGASTNTKHRTRIAPRPYLSVQPATHRRRTPSTPIRLRATPSPGNELESNPLFANNPAFTAALRGALDRQGEDALTSGREAEE